MTAGLGVVCFSLSHLLSVHPILSSARANEHLELVSFPRGSPIVSNRAIAAAAASSSASAVAPPPPPRVTIQSAQLLGLVEILCSGRSNQGGVRDTRESHLRCVGTEALLRPLEHFCIEELDLSSMRSCVDAPLLRAITRLPALRTLNLANCRLVTDAAVAAILHPTQGLRALASLDLSDNTQLKGAWRTLPLAHDADGDGHGDENTANSSATIERPSTLTDLDVSGCSFLSVHCFDFSSRFLGALRRLCARRSGGQFVLGLVRHLHLCRNLQTLELSHATWSATTPRDLLEPIHHRNSSRFASPSPSTSSSSPSATPAANDEDELSSFLRSWDAARQPQRRGGSSSVEGLLEALPGVGVVEPLPHLTSLSLCGMSGLADHMAAFLLAHCALGQLEHLDLSKCLALTPALMHLIASQRLAPTLVALNLAHSAIADDDATWRMLAGCAPLVSSLSSSSSSSSSSSALPSTLAGAFAAPIVFASLVVLSLDGSGASFEVLFCSLGRCCPKLEDLSLCALHRGSRRAAIQAEQILEPTLAPTWNAQHQHPQPQRDALDHIRTHAIARGLPWTDAVAASESSAIEAETPAAASANDIASPSQPPEEQGFGAAFAPCIVEGLPHLRRLALRDNESLWSCHLEQWAAIATASASASASAAATARRADDDDRLGSTPATPPAAAMATATRLTSIDVSGCNNINSEAISTLLQALIPHPHDSSSSCSSSSRGRSSSSSSSTSLSSFLLRADECEHVEASEIPSPWRPYVQASGPFSL